MTAPVSSARTRHLPSHVPRFGSSWTGHSKSFHDYAYAFTTSTITDIVRLWSQVNVPDGIHSELAFQAIVFRRTRLFRIDSVLKLKFKIFIKFISINLIKNYRKLKRVIPAQAVNWKDMAQQDLLQAGIGRYPEWPTDSTVGNTRLDT